jgi:hypothetical protein
MPSESPTPAYDKDRWMQSLEHLALYRIIRQQPTTFQLRGGGALNLEKLRSLAASTL